MKFLARLATVLMSGVIGLFIGFPVWVIAFLIFGAPGDTPNGTRIPSIVRMEHMNYFQWFLESYGPMVIPLICMLAGAALAYRITGQNARREHEQELRVHSVTVEVQDHDAGYQLVE